MGRYQRADMLDLRTEFAKLATCRKAPFAMVGRQRKPQELAENARIYGLNGHQTWGRFDARKWIYRI